ncbi:hypothetical protein B6D60_11755 [candidate division KSB1 bacterium 4484_87]|nr:MAG: hypothetical protein B6D60_11755 [candidate division KSB1 bacterium 4484_87]
MSEKYPEMISFSYECIPCAMGSVINLIKNDIAAPEKREPLIKEVLRFLSDVSFDQSPIEMGRDLHRLIREFLGDADPYAALKQKFNSLLLERYDELTQFVQESDRPFKAALRLAIAGNVIDFVANNNFDIHSTIEKAKTVKLAIDDSEKLEEDIQSAETILYLADNAGEIVLDRILLQTMKHPRVYFAVRGNPVINDATRQDAEQIGLGELVKIIDNGDDAPGTILPDTSAEFKKIFYDADLIISKGQGNFESLMYCHRPLYFILMAKCDHVAKILGVNKGDFIVKKSVG